MKIEANALSGLFRVKSGFFTFILKYPHFFPRNRASIFSFLSGDQVDGAGLVCRLFCFVLTAFIIHLYISLYFNMNNAGGIRGGRGMWERGATQHVSLAVLCSCTLRSGAGGGGVCGLEGEDSLCLVQQGRDAASRSLSSWLPAYLAGSLVGFNNCV